MFAESGVIGKTPCSGSFKVTLEVIYIYLYTRKRIGPKTDP